MIASEAGDIGVGSIQRRIGLVVTTLVIAFAANRPIVAAVGDTICAVIFKAHDAGNHRSIEHSRSRRVVAIAATSWQTGFGYVLIHA